MGRNTILKWFFGKQLLNNEEFPKPNNHQLVPEPESGLNSYLVG
jgi:hypothetical protein